MTDKLHLEERSAAPPSWVDSYTVHRGRCICGWVSEEKYHVAEAEFALNQHQEAAHREQ